MPIPVLSARFSKVDTMLPDWLAMPIRPAGGYGATICAQSDDGVDTMPCPFGPASRTPASSAAAASSCSARRPASPDSAYPPVITNAARTPFARAVAHDVGVDAHGRAHEHEVGRTVGNALDRRVRGDAEDLSPVDVGGEHLARVLVPQDVVEDDEPELAGMRRRTGDDDPAAGRRAPRRLRRASAFMWSRRARRPRSVRRRRR